MRMVAVRLLALVLIGSVRGSPRARRQAGMVALACRRDPTLPYCPKVAPTVIQKPTVPNPATVTQLPTVINSFTHAAPISPLPTTLGGKIEAVIAEAKKGGDIDYAFYCQKYAERYYYYCTDIISQPMELQPKLYRYCPLYRRFCNPLHTSPAPQFPTIPTTVLTTQQPCTSDCTAPHCTPNCKCVYSGKALKPMCTGDGEGGSGAFAFVQNNCQMWWDNCERYLTEKQRKRVEFLMAGKYKSQERHDTAGQTDIMTKHAEKPQNTMWQQPNSVHTDWMNGNVRAGSDWAVPAFGVSGSAGETDVSFPSIGTFMGRKRRKRSFGKGLFGY